MAGFYYLNIDTDSDNGLKFPPNSLATDPFVGGPADLGVDAQLETDSYSLFGQLEYDINDRLTIIAGLRAILEEKDYEFAQSFYTAPTNAREIHQGPRIIVGPVDPFAIFGGGTSSPFIDSTSDNLWAGKIQLDFRPNDDILWYFGVNRGVKAGSFNAQLPGGLPVPTTAIPYGDETLLSYEGGFKWTLGGGSTRINGTVFYYDYKDYQGFLFTGVSGVVVNNDADNQGIELDIQSSPADGLDIIFSAAWFDATVKDVPLRVGGPIIRDVDPVYAPEIQANGLVRYEWPAFGGMLNVQADVSYSDEYFYNLRNFDADKYVSYTKVGAGLSGQYRDRDSKCSRRCATRRPHHASGPVSLAHIGKATLSFPQRVRFKGRCRPGCGLTEPGLIPCRTSHALRPCCPHVPVVWSLSIPSPFSRTWPGSEVGRRARRLTGLSRPRRVHVVSFR